MRQRPARRGDGVHFSNFSLFDDRLDIEHPEALVYEPKNGRLQLVAAEYITPAEAWEASHDDFDLPELMGQLFHFARPQSLQPAGVLRVARLGLEGQSARELRRLEPRSVV